MKGTESSDSPALAEAARFLARVQRRALVLALVLGVLAIVEFVLRPQAAAAGYLIGFLLCFGLTLGCLGILMTQHLSGGVWGYASRRLLEAGSQTVPLLALMFVPVFLARHLLYPWTQAASVAQDATLRLKAPYLNTGAFLARAVLYFVLWWLLARVLQRYADEQTRGTRRDLLVRLQNVSGVGLVIYFLSVTFAAIDWVMSLMPHWYSTVFGMLIVSAQGLAGFAFLTVMAMLLSRYAAFERLYTPDYFHDLGKLLLTFVMLWAYLAYSQLLVTWSGNLPHEIEWYILRTRGGWWTIATLIILIHFALPFALLLSRSLKRHAGRLAALALVILLMRWVDVYWMVEPNFSAQRLHLSVADVLMPAALLSVWFVLFCVHVRRRPLLPPPPLPVPVASGARWREGLEEAGR